MRGLALLAVSFTLLPMVFKRPYIGILMWFWISLMNPHRKVFGFAGDINYALIIAVVTFGSWLLPQPEEPKVPPRDRMTFLIVALMIWISSPSLNGGGPREEIYTSWIDT